MPRGMRIRTRDNYEATANPTVNDDQNAGYSAGSRWLNTVTGQLFNCFNAAIGVADWRSAAGTPQFNALINETAGEIFLGRLFDYGSFGVVTTSEIQYTRVYLTKNIPFDTMRCYVDSQSGAGREIRMGIYEQADPSLPVSVPANRVAQTANVITTNAAFNNVALTAVFTPSVSGYYWLAFITNSPVIKFVVTHGTYRQGYLPVWREIGSGITLPATAGTLSNPTSAVLYCSVLEQ